MGRVQRGVVEEEVGVSGKVTLSRLEVWADTVPARVSEGGDTRAVTVVSRKRLPERRRRGCAPLGPWPRCRWRLAVSQGGLSSPGLTMSTPQGARITVRGCVTGRDAPSDTPRAAEPPVSYTHLTLPTIYSV